jgi:hypothetical protein
MRENRDNWSCVTELGRDILFNFSAFNFGLMRLFMVEAKHCSYIPLYFGSGFIVLSILTLELFAITVHIEW